MLGPHCDMGFSLVVVSRGYPPAAVYGLLTEVASLGGSTGSRTHRLQYLQFPGSGAQAQWLWFTGLAALQLVGSSQMRDQIHVPCTGRGMLYH